MAPWQALEPVLRMVASCSRQAYAPAVLPHVQLRLQELLLTTLLLQASPLLAPLPRASGVASRTLQAAFQSQCGMGPMQWLRAQRLAAVHRHLREATGTSTRVADTALAYGFSHLGEFSRAYRRRFGETPGRALARR